MKRIYCLLLVLVLTGSCAFADEYPRYYMSEFACVAELKAAGLAKAQEVEEEGIVLLKNNGTILPLAEDSRVSVFGITCIDPVYGGTGSGEVETDSAADFVRSFEDAGFVVSNQELIEWYCKQKAEGNLGRNNFGIFEGKWNDVCKNLGDDYEQVRGTAAFFFIGRIGGEGSDMPHDAGKENVRGDGIDYLTLNVEERGILQGLKKLKDDGVITSITVIINSTNPISSGFLFDDKMGVDAALWVGSMGQSGVFAVGRIVSGAVNPSGSLPDTWWMDNMRDPVMNNFGARRYANADVFFPDRSHYEYTCYVAYQEGIYVGYRYTETRYTDVEQGRDGAGSFDYTADVAFPFGYGLSYTTFELSDMQVEKAEDGKNTVYTVSALVANTGNRAGKKTVQIYAQKPYTKYDEENGIEKAAVELVGFAKTSLLAPGDSQQVTVRIPEYYLTSYDTEKSEVFILDEGVYSLICAENAHDAAERLLAASETEQPEGLSPVDNDPLIWRFYQAFDERTYGAAFGTGGDVASRFAFADMNRYDGAEDNAVLYYSRADWEETVTEGPVELTMTNLMASDLVLTDDDLPDEGDFPALGVDSGLQLIDMMDIDWDNPFWDTFMDQLTFEELSEICCTGLRETVAVPRIGKPHTIDHNGPTGVTQSYNCFEESNGYAVINQDKDAYMTGTCYPCNGILAATFNEALIREVGKLVGEDAMWAGYSGLYGTGLNIHRSPYAGRVFEYYSEDSLLCGLMGAAWSQGVQSKGIYVYIKHLVLNDQEENREGLGTWCNEQALREIYLRAFELPIVYAGAKCVMSSYNRLGPIWSGSSHELLTDWLRGEVGLNGFVVTDMFDYDYMVGVNGIVAGNDIPDGKLLAAGYSLDAYREDGEASNPAVVQAMRTSAKRVLYTVLHSRAMDGIAK